MNARDLIIHYSTEYEKKYNEKYPITWSKHPAMLKRLFEFYSPEDVKKLITFYFTEWKDKFTESTGHKLEVFVTQLPALVAALKRADGSRPSDSPDFDRLAAARKSAGNDDQDF